MSAAIYLKKRCILIAVNVVHILYTMMRLVQVLTRFVPRSSVIRPIAPEASSLEIYFRTR